MKRHSTQRPLQGRVAVVSGATRGAGRGIAIELGAAGATVICTGRSTTGTRSPMNRPETIEETAELVTAAGGIGIAHRVDHSNDAHVTELFAQVRRDQQRLDILVNAIWGGDLSMMSWFFNKLKDTNLETGLDLIQQGVWSHLITGVRAAPLMMETRRGLIVELTDGDTPGYRSSVFYDLTKILPMRLALIFAEELRAYRVTAVSLTPGYLRTEMILEYNGVSEANWQDAGTKDPMFLGSESPRYVGRAGVALATDRNLFRKTGLPFSTWALAEEYEFTDVDGRRPDMMPKFRTTLARQYRAAFDRSIAMQETLLARTRWYLEVS